MQRSTSRHQRSTDAEKNYKLAALYIDDALHIRGKCGKAFASTLPFYRRVCIYWISSIVIRYIFYAITLLHCFLRFYEPPQGDIIPGQIPVWVWILHSFCLLLYIVDSVIQHVFYGREIWTLPETRRNRAQFVLVCCFIFDFVLLIIQECIKSRVPPPFRCLRFSIILCKSKSSEHIITVTLLVTKKLLGALVMFTVYIVLFSAIGVHFFANVYHNGICVDKINYGSFDNVGYAFMRMFALLTTENYPAVIVPAMHHSKPNWLFFAFFLYIGNFLLLAILLAYIVKLYWRAAKDLVKEERRRERVSLCQVWNIIDPRGIGWLPIESEIFYHILEAHDKKLTHGRILKILRYLDRDDSGQITPLNWIIYLREALMLKFISDDSATAVKLSSWRLKIKTCISSDRFIYVVYAFTILIGVLYLIQWYGMPPEAALAIQIIRTIIIVLFFVELIMKILLAIVVRRIPPIFEVLQMILTFIAMISTILWFCYGQIPDSWWKRDHYIGLMTTISTLAILVRLPLLILERRGFLSAFVASLSIITALSSVLLAILYAYSVIGLEAFYDPEFTNPIFNNGTCTDVAYPGCGNGFQTLACSFVNIFQIVFANDWENIQYAVIFSVQSKWVSIYFISCFVIIHYLVANLMIAVIIEAYDKLSDPNLQMKSEKMASKRCPKDRRRRNSHCDIENRPGPEGSEGNHSQRFDVIIPDSQRESSVNRLQYRNDVDIDAFTQVAPAHSSSGVQLESPNWNDWMEAPRIDKSKKMEEMRQRKRSVHPIKIQRAFRVNAVKFINVHCNDEIINIERRREYVKASVSRGQNDPSKPFITGWFPADCIHQRKQSIVSSKPNKVAPMPPPPENDETGSQVKPSIDWKRLIIGTITLMNPDEILEMKEIVHANLMDLRKLPATDMEDGHVSNNKRPSEIFDQVPQTSNFLDQSWTSNTGVFSDQRPPDVQSDAYSDNFTSQSESSSKDGDNWKERMMKKYSECSAITNFSNTFDNENQMDNESEKTVKDTPSTTVVHMPRLVLNQDGTLPVVTSD